MTLFRSISLCLILALLAASVSAGEDNPPPPPPTPPGQPGPPAPPAPPAAPTTSLYTRLGGLGKLADLADVLAERISKNEALNTNETFKKNMATLSRPTVRYHITTALCQICGGTEKYTGAPIHEVFKELKLTDEQWKAFAGEIGQTCDAIQLGPNEKREILDYADQINKFATDTATHFFKDKGVSFLLPGHWGIIQNPENTTVILSALGPDPGDGAPRPTLLLMADELAPGIDLTAKEYMKANLLSASKQVKSIKNLAAQSQIFNGEPLESFSYNAGEGKTEMFVETYFMMRNRRAIAIQFSTMKADIEKNKPQFIEALRTLKFE